MKPSKLRHLILGVIAALGLMASANVAVASAAPPGFQVEESENSEFPAFVLGSANLSGFNEFRAFGSQWTCRPPAFRSVPVQNAFSTLTTEEFTQVGECGVNPGGYVLMNGCQFSFEPGPAPTYAGTVSIVPPGCGPIRFINPTPCNNEMQVSPSANFKGSGSFTNLAGGLVQADMSASGLTVIGDCWGKSENGEWDASWKMGADNELESLDLQLVPELPLGFFLAGEASEEESEQPRFEAEHYLRAIDGGGLPTFVTDDGGSIVCEDTGLHGSISGPSKQLTLDATYGACVTTASGGGKFPTSVAMNGCTYTLTAENAGPPYSGVWGIDCPTGKQVEFILTINKEGATCAIRMDTQSGLSGVSLANVGSGPDRGVAIDAEVAGVAYEGCGVSGTGTWTGEPTLMGVE